MTITFWEYCFGKFVTDFCSGAGFYSSAFIFLVCPTALLISKLTKKEN